VRLGADPKNDFGTTKECIDSFNSVADTVCWEKLNLDTTKVYSRDEELKADFGVYFTCAAHMVSKSN